MASTPHDVPEQNSKALPQTAPVAIDAGSSLRDLDDAALNRRRRDAYIRGTPPPDRRQPGAPRRQEKAPGPTRITDEKSRKAAQIEFDSAEEEVKRRIGIMSDEVLIAHIRRLKAYYSGMIPPSDDDSPDNGDWPASLLAKEWEKRQEQLALKKKEAQLEELKASLSIMDDPKLAAECKKIEDMPWEERSTEQHNELGFIRQEMTRRDKAHMSAVDRRDKIRTSVTIFSLVVAIASFVTAIAAYTRPQPFNSVASAGNAPALVVPSTSAPSNTGSATPDPIPSRTPANAAP